jgi:hypothetical protein
MDAGDSLQTLLIDDDLNFLCAVRGMKEQYVA